MTAWVVVVCAALAVGVIVSLLVRLHRERSVEHAHEALEAVERREGNREFLRLLDELQSQDERYAGFTRRVLVGFAVLAVACITALGVEGRLLSRQQELTRQQAQGRAFAITALCSATSAVIDAGQRELLAVSVSAAHAYGRRIAGAVEAQTGVPGLTRKDGTLDCALLNQKSHAPS